MENPCFYFYSGIWLPPDRTPTVYVEESKTNALIDIRKLFESPTHEYA